MKRLSCSGALALGRVALMAEERASSITRNKVVDCGNREAVQVRLRNVARVVLRKYGYPQVPRERMLALATTDGGEIA